MTDPMGPELIFVQIASYRDPELVHTIQSCLTNAEDPGRLTFGICQQYDDATADDLVPYEDDPRFRLDRIHYRESRGCCWARNRTNRLYRGEAYTLQIDAHMRFAPSWDRELIDMMGRVDSDKPVLTTYPPGYSIVNGQSVLSDASEIVRLRLKKLNLDLTTRLEGESVPATDTPGKSPFLAAGFLFTVGRFCVDVEYDPEIYFSGEEISLAARAYTHGYDLYYPVKTLLWHCYDHGGPLHWSDHPGRQREMHETALSRLDTLLLHDHTVLGKYGLGNERSLSDYEDYAGINFARTAARRVLGERTVHFRGTLRLDTSEIERRDDYEFWVFCLLNDDDVEMYRHDIIDAEVLRHARDTIELDVALPDQPTRYMLWPKHREWGRRLYYPLQQEPFSIVVRDSGPKIFVALAAYCEPELVLTIESCLLRALYPERLRFGICLQYDDDGVPEIRKDCLERFESDSRFRITKYPWRESRGGCWARNLAQSLYRGEAFTLQVDSHTRFVAGWDVALLKMMAEFPSRKPLITGFPPLYFRDGEEEEWTDLDDLTRVPTTLVESWHEEGWIDHPTRYLPENTSTPRRTRVLSGAFVFTLGKWNHEVNQDPFHLYTGEEFALTLRSFTHGYDLFNPNHIVVWHRCHPEPNRKYILDFEPRTVHGRHREATQRLRALLSGDPDHTLGPFGLGRERTLEQYRLFSGLDCVNRTVHPDALRGVPPDPVTIASGEMPGSDGDGAPSLEVTIHLVGADPVVLRCDERAPLLDDLYAAVEANALGAADGDPLIYLGFDVPHHERYILQSRLAMVETRRIG
ncbi:MAG: GlcNAc-transferase family protein [Arenicellales bacterium]